MAISAAPAVNNPAELDHESLIQLKQTLASNNPFKPNRINREQRVSLSESNLNQAIQLGLQHKKLHIPTKLTLKENLAEIKSSLQIFDSTFYLNFSIGITTIPTRNQQLTLQNMKVGQLTLPRFLLEQLSPFALQLTERYLPELILALQSVESVSIKPAALTVSYRWSQQLTEKIRSAASNLILADDEYERVKVYYQKLIEMNILNMWRNMSVTQVLYPLFSLATQQTLISNDAVAENRAAIIAIGLAISSVPPHYVFREKLRRAYLLRVTLINRRDLAKHFLISSALSVITNQALSNAVGLSKEINDSRGGSGFSFPDLLADRAGVKFAELATSNDHSARHVQRIMTNPNLAESDFMPTYNNLPESITELQFKQKYISPLHPNYLIVEEEINRRIKNSVLHKKQA